MQQVGAFHGPGTEVSLDRVLTLDFPAPELTHYRQLFLKHSVYGRLLWYFAKSAIPSHGIFCSQWCILFTLGLNCVLSYPSNQVWHIFPVIAVQLCPSVSWGPPRRTGHSLSAALLGSPLALLVQLLDAGALWLWDSHGQGKKHTAADVVSPVSRF